MTVAETRSSQFRSPHLLLVLVSALLILGVSFGARATMGLFVNPISETMGWGIAVFSFALAGQNLIWGLAQPFAGMFADRFGPKLTLILGTLIYIAGLAGMTVSTTELLMNITAGMLIGAGIAATSFPIVLGAVGKAFTGKQRTLALGIATSGGSLGQFAVVPATQWVLGNTTWQSTLFVLCGVTALMIPLMFLMLRGTRGEAAPVAPALSLGDALGEAMRHSGYWLLVAGFFVCGFHVAFIGVHMPNFVALCGLSPSVGAFSLALIGLFNIIGTVTAGWLGGFLRMKHVLSWIYLGRAVAILGLLLLPQTEITIYAFSALMGVLWLSTVPLTSGLVAQIFGPAYMTTLYGIVFLSHQVGSFVGVWLGGAVFDATGNYNAVWITAIALGIFAAVVHWPIRDAPLRLEPV
jgi:predicted MFS family arabinose efflux permease